MFLTNQSHKCIFIIIYTVTRTLESFYYALCIQEVLYFGVGAESQLEL